MRYELHYRTGGTANYRWHAALPTDAATAEQQRIDTERMGYRCYVAPAGTPLPTTYTGQMWPDGLPTEDRQDYDMEAAQAVVRL